jgi:glutaredoxin
MLATVRFLLLFLCSMPLWADDNSSWYAIDTNKQVTINVELFLSSTCPHCHKADAFFREIEPKTPWLQVKRNIINEDKDALIRFNQFLTELKFNDFAVPSTFFCNSRWVGFDSNETTGNDVLKALHYCKEQIEQKGTLTVAAVDVIKRWANANMFNSGVTDQPSALHYFLVVALLDVTNPCSLFSFAGFLAVLSIQYSRKNQLISGLLFILAIVIVHFIQQTQANVFFQILPWLRPVALLMGLISLYIAFRYYEKQMIKPHLFFIWAFFLALIVQSYQQTCLMNWSYIFEQWLFNQQLSAGQKTIIQFIYQLVYIVPLFVVLLGYLALNLFKFFALIKPRLEIIGWLFIAIIALFLIAYPIALSYYLPAFLILSAAFIGGLVLSFYLNNTKNS